MRYRLGVIAVGLLLLALLSSLHIMSGAVQNSESLSSWFEPVLVFTFVGLIILLVLILVNLVALIKQRRRDQPGSRLTTRMVLLFIGLSVAPAVVVYHYSLQFLLSGIDSWFDVRTDKAMADALDLSRASLDLHRRNLQRHTRQVLIAIEDSSQAALALSLAGYREAVGATEIALLDQGGQVIASSNVDPDQLVPEKVSAEIVQQVKAGKDYSGLDAQDPNIASEILVVVADPSGRPIMLQASYPTSENIRSLSASVQEAHIEYTRKAYLRSSLKFTFALTLSLVLAVSFLAAVWAAFFTSRRLVRPITDIAVGTRSVAEGDYSTRLPVPRSRDELGFLVSSFNAMTRRIGKARDQIEDSRRQLQTQHAYLETVLGSLSSGVIAVDASGRLERSNPAAREILRLPPRAYSDCTMTQMAEASEQLVPFAERIQLAVATSSESQQDWREEIVLHRAEGRQVLLCRGSGLVLEDGSSQGMVVVFDDVTALIKAQRDAAWGEVARRLAHEIKNPLTPIQLSAERLRHKYLEKLPPDDVAVLERATTTIIHQVRAMKDMVQDFAEYARPSTMAPTPLLLDAFLHEVLGLYEGDARLPMQLRLGASSACVEADPGRLRQVIHNLVKNALEAVAGQDDPLVEINTGRFMVGEREWVRITICDNGPGFDANVIGQVFEPYVTTKAKGTGLGLAIVKKIIEEHSGVIKAENRVAGGGEVVLDLPVCYSIDPPEEAREQAGDVA